MKLSKCCDAEVTFGMVDDTVGHGIHEETECSNCGELYPDVYDDEECEHENTYIAVRHTSGASIRKCSNCNKIV
jgi:hypothetical protein